MNAAEARTRIDAADRLLSEGNSQDAAALYSSVIAGLPRNDEARALAGEAYEGLVKALVKEERWMHALDAFGQYVSDCAPRCDPSYDQIYQEGLLATRMLPLPFMRRQRFHSLVQLFRRAMTLQGLMAECGCFRGLSSYLLCSIYRLEVDRAFDGRGYRIFDSFQGLSPPQPEDAIEDSDPQAARLRKMTSAGRFAAPLAHVKQALQRFPRIEFFPGWIPESFPDEPAARYRFVHLDVDVHQPTRDSLEYFFPRMVPGGIMVCDDYSWPGARKAIEEFCARVGVPFETTPHAQAYIARGA